MEEAVPRFAHHRVIRKIGEGSYGKVFLARSKSVDEKKQLFSERHLPEEDKCSTTGESVGSNEVWSETPGVPVRPTGALSTPVKVSIGQQQPGAVGPLPINPLNCPTPLGRSATSSVNSSSLITPYGAVHPLPPPPATPLAATSTGGRPNTPLIVINTRTNRTLRAPAGRGSGSQGEASTPQSLSGKGGSTRGAAVVPMGPMALGGSVDTAHLTAGSSHSFGSNTTSYSAGVPFTSTSNSIFKTPQTLQLDDEEQRREVAEALGVGVESGGDEGTDANQHIAVEAQPEVEDGRGVQRRPTVSPPPRAAPTGMGAQGRKFKVSNVTPHLKVKGSVHDLASVDTSNYADGALLLTGHSNMESVFTPMESRPSKSKFGYHHPGNTPRSPSISATPRSLASSSTATTSVVGRRPSGNSFSSKHPPTAIGMNPPPNNSVTAAAAAGPGVSQSEVELRGGATKSNIPVEEETRGATEVSAAGRVRHLNSNASHHHRQEEEESVVMSGPHRGGEDDHTSSVAVDVEDESAERKHRNAMSEGSSGPSTTTGPLIPSLRPDVFGEDYEPAEVAIKVIAYYNDHGHPGRVQRIWQELAILHAAQGIPQVVPLYGIEEAVHPPDPVIPLMPEENDAEDGVSGQINEPQRDLHIRMAYVPFNLWRLITSGRLSRETEMIMPVVGQLLLGLTQLHEDLGVVHRDLSSGNILVGNKLDTYICDFGFAKIAEDRMSQGVITQRYRAPEVILDCYYDHKVDVWAAGVMMVELFMQTSLFPAKQGDLETQLVGIMEVLGEISDPLLEDDRAFGTASVAAKNYVRRKNKLGSIVEPKGIDGLLFKVKPSPLALDLMANLLALNPHTRYSAAQALRHPFFQSNKEFASYVASSSPPGPDCAPAGEDTHETNEPSSVDLVQGKGNLLGASPASTPAPKLKLMGDETELNYVQRVRSILTFYNTPPTVEEGDGVVDTTGGGGELVAEAQPVT